MLRCWAEAPTAMLIARARCRQSPGQEWSESATPDVASFVALIATAVLVEQPWTWCPTDWSDAPRIHLSSSGSYVVLDGREFQVGGDALLDYMPRIVTSPLDQARANRHPLTIVASIWASSRD